MSEVIVREPVLPAVREDTASLVAVIERAALNPEVDLDKMERLLAMKERIDAKTAESAFNSAMAFAQSEMGRVSADATNPQTRSRYASYANLDRHLRPIYTRHGFALSFDTGDSPAPEHVRVVCHVTHRDGHSRDYRCDMPADGKGAKGGDVMTKTHATGSAMAYGMRYLLKLIFNVAVGEDDDDGNTASDPVMSAAHAKEIKDLLAETKSDTAKFLAAMGGFASVDDMPERAYSTAKARLLKKKETQRASAKQ